MTVTDDRAPLPRPPVAHPSWLARLTGSVVDHRVAVVLTWVALVVAGVVLAVTTPAQFNADYRAQGAESTQAQQLLEDRFAAAAGMTVTVVARSEAAAVTDPAVQGRVEQLLAEMSEVPSVTGTHLADPALGEVSADGTTSRSTVQVSGEVPQDVPEADSGRIIELAEAASGDGLEVSVDGNLIQNAESGDPGSEGIGLIAAAIVLLISFGAVVAAGLPIGVAVAGVLLAMGLLGPVSRVVDVPDWATAMVTMMGVGVGIDYALLMLTRFREELAAGRPVREAVVRTVDTSGRSVLVAAATVVLALVGLATIGLEYMTGAALGTMLAVGAVALASVTLLPAMLSLLGRRVDALRIPGRRRSSGGTARWAAFARVVGRRPVVATLLGAALLALLALPALDPRYGFPGSDAAADGTQQRTSYENTVEAFGEGFTAPLTVVTDLEAVDPAQREATVAAVADVLAADGDVVSVSPPVPSPEGDVVLLTAVPVAGATATSTADLVDRLRDRLPAAVSGSGADVLVGGQAAANIDTNDDVSGRLTLLVAGVIVIGALLLVAAFRSVAVAVKALVLNLLSIAAAVGVVSYALTGGWFGGLFGIDNPAPLPAFVPVLMFAILFGLSMDYEVFILSRIREAWTSHPAEESSGRAGDALAREAVVEGIARTGGVITAAAAIMVVVFGAFVLSSDIVLKTVGLGLASAVLIDATIVRMLLVPALMTLLGRRAWWLPRWLDRAVPALHVEGHPEPLPAPQAPEFVQLPDSDRTADLSRSGPR